MRSARVAFLLVLGGAAFLIFYRLGAIPLMDPDEARFARTSVEMMRSGDLVVPTFEGKPRIVKPPLFHWIQSWFFRVLDVSESAARLPAAMATFVSMLLVAWIARRRFGTEGGCWAVAVFVTIPLVFAIGRIGTLDALLAMHVAAVYALDMAGPKETRAPYRGAAIGALLGLAFLVKGPVGVFLPLVVILAGRTAAGREVVPSWRNVLGAVAGWATVVLPWGLAFMERIGWGQGAATLRTEAFERYYAGTAHVEPPWFYAKVVAVGFIPWVVPLVFGAARAFRRRNDPQARTALYASAGLLAGLLFFSLGKGKLPNYILPLAPLVAILVAWELGQQLNSPRERRWGPNLLAATLVALAFVFSAASVMRLDDDILWATACAAGVYAVGALVAMVGATLGRPRWVFGAAAGSAAVVLMVVLIGVGPILARERSAAALVERIPELTSGRPLVLVETKLPGLTFYADRNPEHMGGGDVAGRLGRADRPIFLIAERDLPAIPAEVRGRLRRIGSEGKIRVLEESSGPNGEGLTKDRLASP